MKSPFQHGLPLHSKANECGVPKPDSLSLRCKNHIGVVEPFRMTNRNDVHSAAERAQADSFIQHFHTDMKHSCAKNGKMVLNFPVGNGKE